MTDPTPRCPKWAIEGGFPEPSQGESYRDFWARAGAKDDVIDWSLDVRKGAEDVANDRMGTWLRLYRPGVFLEALDRMAYRSQIPVHRVGV